LQFSFIFFKLNFAKIDKKKKAEKPLKKQMVFFFIKPYKCTQKYSKTYYKPIFNLFVSCKTLIKE